MTPNYVVRSDTEIINIVYAHVQLCLGTRGAAFAMEVCLACGVVLVERKRDRRLVGSTSTRHVMPVFL